MTFLDQVVAVTVPHEAAPEDPKSNFGEQSPTEEAPATEIKTAPEVFDRAPLVESPSAPEQLLAVVPGEIFRVAPWFTVTKHIPHFDTTFHRWVQDMPHALFGHCRHEKGGVLAADGVYGFCAP